MITVDGAKFNSFSLSIEIGVTKQEIKEQSNFICKGVKLQVRKIMQSSHKPTFLMMQKLFFFRKKEVVNVPLRLINMIHKLK